MILSPLRLRLRALSGMEPATTGTQRLRAGGSGRLWSFEKTPPGTERRTKTMARKCELTGKGVQSGHLVSHSNRKTKRKFLPNLCSVTLQSDALNLAVRLRVSANALRSVEHRGGLDAFLIKASADELSTNARSLKRQIEKKIAGAAA